MPQASTVKVEKSARQTRYMFRIVAAVLLILGSLSLAIVLMISLLGESGLHASTLKVMHMSHASDQFVIITPGESDAGKAQLSPRLPDMAPRSWLSLDSIMRPLPGVSVASLVWQHNTDIVAGTSFDGQTQLGLDSWQKTSLCPYSTLKMETWNAEFEAENGLTVEQREQVFCKDADETHCPRGVAADDQIKYPNPIMREVCRLNRVAPMFVTENDTTSYSIFSAHSTHVLQLFIQLILLVLGSTELAKNLYKNKYHIVYEAYKAKTGDFGTMDDCKKLMESWKTMVNYSVHVVSVAALILVICVKGGMVLLKNLPLDGVVGAEVEGTFRDVYARASPNGSFLYGFFALLIIYIWSVRSLSALDTEMSSVSARAMNSESIVLAEITMSANPPMNNVEDSKVTPPTRSQSESQMNDGQGLNISGFMGKKIPISAYQVDRIEFKNRPPAGAASATYAIANKSSSSINKILNARPFQQGTWSILQFCLLPLWVLCGMTLAQGYEVDVDVQLVFIASFVWAVSDLYLDRFITITEAVHILDPEALHWVEAYITTLIVVIQLILVLAINFVTGWRYSERALTDDISTMRTTDAPAHERSLLLLNSSSIVWFNVYFGVTGLLKLYKVFFKRKEHSDTTRHWKTAWFSVKTIDELLLGFLILFIFIYNIMVIAGVDRTDNWFSSLYSKYNSDTALTLEAREAMIWGAGWQLA